MNRYAPATSIKVGDKVRIGKNYVEIFTVEYRPLKINPTDFRICLTHSLGASTMRRHSIVIKLPPAVINPPPAVINLPPPVRERTPVEVGIKLGQYIKKRELYKDGGRICDCGLIIPKEYPCFH